ncbi:MAG TPA: GDSL-type esterase/lipase family protein [Bryobacteraceae bacterium]|nr:GDSL-type esterase/lipase family protein [Bryobacteraceae bacterium]
MRFLPAKTALTIATLAALMALIDALPQRQNYKLLDYRTLGAVLDFIDRRPADTPNPGEQPRSPGLVKPTQPKLLLTDPAFHLDRFFQALHSAEGRAGQGVARILHYGDSPTTADLITSDVRYLLQKQFGDAGHGFCLVAKPWAWYAHKGLDPEGSGWTIDAANYGALKDGMYGLGAVSFRGGPGAFARIKVRDRTYRQVEIGFLRQPDGGQIHVETNSGDLGLVETSSEQRGSGFARFRLPDHASEIILRVTSGSVRVFGISLEKDSSGVVYHSLGINGGSVSVLARSVNEAHWGEQLRHYRPNLIVINYGTNESMYPNYVDFASEKEMREVLRRIRKAAPEASILVMSPMDRGERLADGEIGTAPAIPRLVAIQERVARENGCAFFNTFAAMGGTGTMGRWYEAEPRLVGADFIHPMPAGAKIVGGLLYQALFQSYNRYKLRLLQNKIMVAGN